MLQACMFFISAFSFVTLVQVVEPTFSGWTDVFFFCGRTFEFCNCDLSWNALGAHLRPFSPRLNVPGTSTSMMRAALQEVSVGNV